MEVKATGANLVMIQETHAQTKGKIAMDGFVVFEAIRNKKGGGTMCAVHEEFSPKLVNEYSDDFELLVVEMKTNTKDLRVITGYGPQENIDEEKPMPFFLALEKEIIEAKNIDRSIIIELDANSKLGKSIS